MSDMSGVQLIRLAVKEALPEVTAVSGTVDPKVFYIPGSHLKLLSRGVVLVSGGRGSGKSFWATALTNDATLEILAQAEPSLKGFRGVKGFASESQIECFPDEPTFRKLVQDGCEIEDIWRGVILRGLAGLHGQEMPTGDWGEIARWVNVHPEQVAQAMEQANAALAMKGEGRLIVFDALDRSARDWDQMDQILKGLLRIVLSLSGVDRIRAKVFLRNDQMTPQVRAFPDASKLTATMVELTWQPHDLHALLWQYLVNAPTGHCDTMHRVYQVLLGIAPTGTFRRFELHTEVRRDTPTQRVLFEVLAGGWMGHDRRRGVPYTWIVGHLADGKGRTSPRSFLAAVRAAALDTQERYPDHEWPLHFESIKRGVQSASQIRVAELAEDFPWVTAVMAPLRGMNVPCEFNDIKKIWSESFPNGLPIIEGDSEAKLPPPHGDSWQGLADDLVRLGVFENLRGDRINLPDLYRIGFGLGRRGGVRPVRTA